MINRKRDRLSRLIDGPARDSKIELTGDMQILRRGDEVVLPNGTHGLAKASRLLAGALSGFFQGWPPAAHA